MSIPHETEFVFLCNYHDHCIQERGINILGLNTRSNYDSRSGYKDNFVSCLCSTRKQRNVIKALADAGALNVEVGMFNLSNVFE